MQFRKQLDSGSANGTITKMFLTECQTPKPKSIGVCFKDTYLNNSWEEAPKMPSNNCYFSVPYPYHWTADMIQEAGVDDVSEWEAKLDTFLEGLYWGNAAVFQLEMASLHMAFLRICTSKMKFKIGPGGALALARSMGSCVVFPALATCVCRSPTHAAQAMFSVISVQVVNRMTHGQVWRDD